jgi:hypothetical protein
LIRHTLIALGAALLLSGAAHAQDEAKPEEQAAAAAAAANLLPDSVNLSVVEGSSVPADCQYPSTISDTTNFELACVTMARFNSGMIGAEYLAELGRMGWVQGDYIEGGMTAVRTDENHCERVLNIFPSDFPPGEAHSANAVIWFVLERTPRCSS